MVINAVVINRSDPGAVPGASTKTDFSIYDADLWGRNRIDEGVKSLAFTRHDTTVIGSNIIVANDNYAEAALAA